ncbi:MAG TPA: bifunctional 5,10-methylenetetrahydrofolate dehydrogenase/5,10-methenyltetrahydrofolate cyclohydrolase [Candidatus Xenobia bacterium]
MAKLLDGRPVAERIRASLQDALGERAATGRPRPNLVIVMAGDDPASASYAQSKTRLCERLGLKCAVHHFPATIGEAPLTQEIARFAQDPSVHGLLVELPLPKGLSTLDMFRGIPVTKDVEGMSVESVARLAQGSPLFVPATPAAVLRLLDHYEIDVQGRHVVVVGRSRVVGRPLASLLLTRNATVTVCHSFTPDLAAVTRQADILVVAMGQPHFIGPRHVRAGAVVIDVGTNYQDGVLRGDVDFAQVEPVASWISPVPGGVGLVTTSLLVQNVVRAAEIQEAPAQHPWVMGGLIT